MARHEVGYFKTYFYKPNIIESIINTRTKLSDGDKVKVLIAPEGICSCPKGCVYVESVNDKSCCGFVSIKSLSESDSDDKDDVSILDFIQ